ncbi:type II secretion system protein [Kribbella capetownensis]|uniref:Type II secretion system protein n=1 Tax=Kribbella capetownensis TaxID=1572659 RepID=A0A4R0JY00_9ACTN|nr:type II secretion system F family protein [Kribbella capetownensis]TCC52443.1 type II secretion system protein [Kribbella capetownensis]
MNPAFVAGLLAFFVVVLVLPIRGRGLHRLTARIPSRSDSLTRRWLAGPIAVTIALLFGAQILVSVIAIGVIAALIVVQRAQHQRRLATAARRAQIIEALDVLAAELTAGRPPIDALEGATTISPDFQIAHAAARLGGDVPGALELAAEAPGAGGLRALAAAWRVAEESGAAFASLTERLSDSLRADETIHRQTAASLAGAHSTARILAALPVFGIALGYSLGARPLTFLTATPAGWVCLAAGLALTTLGLNWTTHLAKVPT